MNKLEIAPLINPSYKYARHDKEDTLGGALQNVKNSHEPVFVFDGEQFVGLVSPHTTLYKNRYPANSKLHSCISEIKKIHPDTSIFDVVKIMIDTRLYTLPVVDDGMSILGVVEVDKVVREILKDPEMVKRVEDSLQITEPVVCNDTATVSQVYAIMRDSKISRVILNHNDELIGIVSRSDIQGLFAQSADRPRFSSGSAAFSWHALNDEKIGKLSTPAITYATKKVITAPSSCSDHELIKKLLESPVHSIVIADGKKATGIISYFDILKAIHEALPKKDIPLIVQKMHDDDTNLSPEYLTEIEDMVREFAHKVQKRKEVERVHMHIDQPKNTAGLPKKMFDVHLRFLFADGTSLDATASERYLHFAVKHSFKEIERQLGKNGGSQHAERVAEVVAAQEEIT